MDEKFLVAQAIEARKNAYTPYSHFQVGAALLAADGTVFRGCNIENASYTPTNCAERTAFFKAVSEGVREFTAIAIVGGPADAKSLELCAPCGVCRQVMREFTDYEKFIVLLGKAEDVNDSETITWERYTLKELLPFGFGPENLA